MGVHPQFAKTMSYCEPPPALTFVNIVWSLIAGKKAPDNPWGEGATTLEWTLSSPPPFHQFETLPRVD